MSEYRFIEKPRTSCALGGALAAMAAMPEVIPIIHTSTGCGGNLSNALSYGSGYVGNSYCSGNAVPISAITETEIVFGGNDRLREEIGSALKLIDGKLFVVVTGCMTEMIGDDAAGTVSEFAENGTPIIALSTPSFKGDSYVGYEILVDGIFNRFLPETGEKQSDLVNIFGIIPGYDPFFRGDLEEIERILSKLGLKANTFFSPTQTFDNITSAGKAALNIVFSRTRCGDFAENFEKRHGTPYWITDLPIGPEATDRFVREAAGKLNISEEIAEKVIIEENALYYKYFERTVDIYTDSDLRFYGIVVANSNYALPLSRYLYNELGWIIADAFVTDILNDKQKAALEKAFDENGQVGVKPYFEPSSIKINRAIIQNHKENQGERYFDGLTPLYVLGSTYDKAFALKRGAKFLSVSYPVYDRVIVTQGYAGYRGALRLFEDIVTSFMAQKQ
jgi:nitrogenase molybdenum-iron protein beta chain